MCQRNVCARTGNVKHCKTCRNAKRYTHNGFSLCARKTQWLPLTLTFPCRKYAKVSPSFEQHRSNHRKGCGIPAEHFDFMTLLRVPCASPNPPCNSCTVSCFPLRRKKQSSYRVQTHLLPANEPKRFSEIVCNLGCLAGTGSVVDWNP